MQMKKLAAALMLAGLACAVAAEEVRVAVAANFMAPMKELAPLYEKATGDKLVVSYGATGAFYAQIKNGAPFDVLLAADAKTPAKAVKEATALPAPPSRMPWQARPLVLRRRTRQGPEGPSPSHREEGRRRRRSSRSVRRGRPSGARRSQDEGGRRAEVRRQQQHRQDFQFVESGNTQIGFVALSQCFKNGAFTGGSGWSFRRTSTSPSFRMPSSSRQARRTPAPSASSTT